MSCNLNNSEFIIPQIAHGQMPERPTAEALIRFVEKVTPCFDSKFHLENRSLIHRNNNTTMNLRLIKKDYFKELCHNL